ncbi:hypothetical protein AJ79_02809 [Helicocarpus griseus UAMH5409]|uniref:CinA C-terminal domain-containing protein n=1 Tax=Helicocarpus griseus UAMH5409 TaxID=1447875 RepID=A0A2B7Y178_9EURO|nr:hypothetical protein AJ79_02809 [Helicocarpus griseus UAMH5409]
MPSEFPPPSLRDLRDEVANLLKEKHESVSIAETASGGLLSATLLSAPGASSFYKGGLTVYTLPSRLAYAGWAAADIESYAGPTPAVVAGMAGNVRATLQSTYALCESGTAGPTASGEGRNRQPGYVALAVSCAAGTYTREVETGLGGDREGNMVAFAREGLRFVRDVINGEAKL